jgi:CubicO group peptidase (beta-lactamase class C family)
VRAELARDPMGGATEINKQPTAVARLHLHEGGRAAHHVDPARDDDLGLTWEPDDLPAFLKGPVAERESVMLRALERTSYAHPPDTRYLYSNIGYAALGAAIARAARTPHTQLVTECILTPLGMKASAFEPPAGLEERLAKGYAVERDEAGARALDAETPAREHGDRGYKVPNGALYTAVDDLARFVAFEAGFGPATRRRPTSTARPGTASSCCAT